MRLAASVTLASCVAFVSTTGCVQNESPSISQPDAAIPVIALPDGAAPPAPDSATPTAGPGILSIVEKAFDFGLVDCGATGTAKTFTVTNVGESPVIYQASVDGPFTLSGATSGTVAPGANVTVTLATKTVPTTSTAGVALTGQLTVTSDIPGAPEVKLPVSLTPRGAMLTLAPSPADFGQVKIGATSESMPLTLKNDGNGDVSVTPAAKKNGDFSLDWSGSPGAIALAAASQASLTSSFAPTVVGSQQKSVALAVTGAVCGAPLSEVALKGEGTYGPVTVTPGTVDFGTTDCGAKANNQTVKIKNENAFSLTYQASLPNGSLYAVSPSSGTVAAGAEVSLTVSSGTLTAPRSVAANAYGDTLTITTNAPNDTTPHTIGVKQSARGAIVGLTMNSKDFGSGTLGVAKSLPYTLTNTGNVAVTVNATVAAPFSSSPASSALAATTGTATPNALFTPTAGGAASKSLSFSLAAAAPLCAALPSAVTLTGTGLVPKYVGDQPIGPLGVSCGSAATPSKAIVIKNDATATGALVLSNIAITGPATVTPTSVSPIAPGGQVTLTVAAKAPVLNAAADLGGTNGAISLTFNTNDAAASSVTYAGTRPVSGANLSYVRYNFNTQAYEPIVGTFDVAGCPFVTTPGDYFHLSNSGNVDGLVNLTPAIAPWTFYFDGSNPLSVIAGGTSMSVTASYGGPIGTTTTAQSYALFSLPVGGGNVCKMPDPLSIRYVALPANAPQCM